MSTQNSLECYDCSHCPGFPDRIPKRFRQLPVAAGLPRRCSQHCVRTAAVQPLSAGQSQQLRSSVDETAGSHWQKASRANCGPLTRGVDNGAGDGKQPNIRCPSEILMSLHPTSNVSGATRRTGGKPAEDHGASASNSRCLVPRCFFVEFGGGCIRLDGGYSEKKHEEGHRLPCRSAGSCCEIYIATLQSTRGASRAFHSSARKRRPRGQRGSRTSKLHMATRICTEQCLTCINIQFSDLLTRILHSHSLPLNSF